MATNLRLPFNDDNIIPETFSGEGQDLFAISVLNGKYGGTFLDIGANDAKTANNTLLLERHFGWRGVCVDLLENIPESYVREKRTAKLLIQDATTLDFDSIIAYLGTEHVDYLSLDLEPASITYKCLTTIPFNRLEFSAITFEHDAYRHGDQCRIDSRKYLADLGYDLLCADVGTNYTNSAFEDWYVNPKYVDMDRAEVIRFNGAMGKSIVIK
jgi:hypothetical protein